MLGYACSVWEAEVEVQREAKRAATSSDLQTSYQHPHCHHVPLSHREEGLNGNTCWHVSVWHWHSFTSHSGSDTMRHEHTAPGVSAEGDGPEGELSTYRVSDKQLFWSCYLEALETGYIIAPDSFLLYLENLSLLKGLVCYFSSLS